MADSVDIVLEFLRRNRFRNAEAALRGELSIRSLDESLERNHSKGKEVREQIRPYSNSAQQDAHTQRSSKASQEFIVEDFEVRRTGNGMHSKKGMGIDQGEEGGLTDLYDWSSNSMHSANEKDIASIANTISELKISAHPKYWPGQLVLNRKSPVGPELEFLSDQSNIYIRSDEKFESKDCLENPWSKREELSKECSVKTVFPLSSSKASTSYHEIPIKFENQMERKKEQEHDIINESTKQQSDDAQMPYFSEVSQVLDQRNTGSFNMPLIDETHRGGLPRLPHVRIKSVDKLVNMNVEEKSDVHGSPMKPSGDDNAFLIGSFLDVPVGLKTSGIVVSCLIGNVVNKEDSDKPTYHSHSYHLDTLGLFM